MRSAGLVLCGAFAAWATTTPGAAQTTAPTPESSPAATNRFDIGANARVSYDSNVARSGAALAASRGIKPQDEIFTPRLSIDMAKPVGALSVLVKGGIGYDFYRRNEHLNREQIDLSSGLAGNFDYCNATLTGNLARHQSDLLELAQSVTENVETVTSVSLNALCGRATGLVPAFSATQQWWRNSAALVTTSDFNSFSSTAGVGYRSPGVGELSIFGRFEETDFPHRFILVGSDLIKDSYQIYAAGLRWDKSLGPYLEIVLSPLYTSLRPGLPGATGFEGTSYEAQLTVRPTPLLRGSFAFQRSPVPTMRHDVTFSLSESYSAIVDYTISPQWTFEFGGLVDKQNFKGVALVNGVDISHETIDAVFASIRYTLRGRYSLSLDVRREDRDANLTDFNYKTYIVGLAAEIAF